MANRVFSLLAVGLSLLLSGCSKSGLSTTTTSTEWPWPTTDAPSEGPSIGPSAGPTINPQCIQLAATECLDADLSFHRFESQSAEDCCAICTFEPDCNAWTFDDAAQECRLKSDCSRRRDSAGHTSGFRGHPWTCELREGTDCEGRNFADEAAETPEDCCDLCSKTAGCTAFSHRLEKFDGHNSSWCYLKHGCTMPKSDPQVTSGFTGAPQPLQCEISNDTRCTGQELNRTLTRDKGACCDLCASTSACAAFSFAMNNSQPWCTLHTTCGTTEVQHGAVSGTYKDPSQCQAPLPGVSCESEDLDDFYSWGYSDCCDRCGMHPSCAAFTFDSKDKEHGTTWCRLKPGCGLDEQTASATATSGTLPTCWAEWGQACVGEDLGGAGLHTSDDCCNFCASTPGCTAYVHWPNGDERHTTAWCYLLGSCEHREDCENACSSGVHRGWSTPTWLSA